MPGRLLTPQTGAAAAGAESRETGVPMGVYRLTIPEAVQESLNPNARNGSSSFKSQQQQFLRDYRNSAYPSPKPSRYLEVPLITPSKTWLESPELGQFDDGSTSSVFTSGSSRTSHTSHATSDDDFLLMDCASRTCSIDDVFPQQAPKRHSSASYSDMAFRREQRKRLVVVPPSEAMDTQRDTSLAMTLSFRRELDVEDERVDESLALWEDEDTEVDHQTRRKVVNEHPAPHSWHAGDSTASTSGSSRNKKKKKRSSTFFNGLFSGLSISSSRKFRKSVS